MATIRHGRPQDLDAVRALLRDARLPESGLEACIADLLVADDSGEIAGAAALERAGDGALLRSLVVRASKRGTGLGDALARAIVDRARASGIVELWLLTETADAFFEKRGFMRAARGDAPAAVRETEEFRSLCPDSAVAMRLPLG